MRTFIAILTFTLTCTFASAETEKYRVIWNDAPHSKATIGWCKIDGDNAKVLYRKAGDEGEWLSHGVDRTTSHLDLESCFSRLEGLEPATAYEFQVVDSNSKSDIFRFTTAPDGPADFAFIAGGDSRNHRDARQRANRTVALLRPLFVTFGGDMISKPVTQDWSAWLDDWQLTTGKDGHMIPIIAARGNHESSKCVHAYFDTPHADDFYALDVGAGFLRVYTLNTNIVRAGEQGDWLEEDLEGNSETTWKFAHYHHPFRPHQSKKSEQNAQYNAWARLFFEHGMDLVVECDSHVVKRTWPVRPSNGPGSDEGFVRDDEHGTTFLGEGCWGAPLRRNDDDKNWTRASGSFNQINWICVTPEKIITRTVKVDSIDEVTGEFDSNAPFALPDGLEVWEPDSGATVALYPRGDSGRPAPDPLELARLEIIGERKFAESVTVRIEIKGASDDAAEKAQVRFTTDGNPPASDSTPYTEPFEINSSATIRAAIFRGEKLMSVEKVAAFERAGGGSAE